MENKEKEILTNELNDNSKKTSTDLLTERMVRTIENDVEKYLSAENLNEGKTSPLLDNIVKKIEIYEGLLKINQQKKPFQNRFHNESNRFQGEQRGRNNKFSKFPKRDRGF